MGIVFTRPCMSNSFPYDDLLLREGEVVMSRRVLTALLALVAISVVASGCGSGSSSSAARPEVSPNREAGIEDRTELCVWTWAPEGELTVTFRDPKGRVAEPVALTGADACATYSPYATAQISNPATGLRVMDLDASNENHAESFKVACQPSAFGTDGWLDEKYRTDMFDAWSPPKSCHGYKVTVTRKADSGNTYEYNVVLDNR